MSSPATSYTFQCMQPIMGRFVSVQRVGPTVLDEVLQFCELQVYGK